MYSKNIVTSNNYNNTNYKLYGVQEWLSSVLSDIGVSEGGAQVVATVSC